MSKTILVSGATSGIGRATALALADQGWWVAASGRDRDRGAELADLLGERGTFLACDLLDDRAIDGLVGEIVASRGALDALVNNAGVHGLGSLAQLQTAQLDEILAADLRAPILLARAAVREMASRGSGVVVNVASEAGIVAVPGQVAYNIAKAGLIMLTRSIAVDHAQDGVRAVSVCPGTTRTPLVEAAIASAPDPVAHERWLSELRPARRLGRVEEIAAAICFAVSDEAGFLTGTEIVIDGGYTAT